jgi:hypothetical protein
MAESQDIAERILGEARYQKKDERNKKTLVFEKMVVRPDDGGFDEPLHKGKTQETGEKESQQGTDDKTNGGINRPHGGAKKIPADQTGHIARQGADKNLKRLKKDKHGDGMWTKGRNKCPNFFLVEEEAVEIEMKDEKKSEGDQHGKQDETKNGPDGLSKNACLFDFLHSFPRQTMGAPGETSPDPLKKQPGRPSRVVFYFMPVK